MNNSWGTDANTTNGAAGELTLYNATSSLVAPAMEVEGDAVFKGKVDLTDAKVIWPKGCAGEYTSLVAQVGELKQEIQHLQVMINKEVIMFSPLNILVIVVICIVTVKYIIPRMSIRWLVRKFVSLVWRPGMKYVREARSEWRKCK